MTHRTHNPTRTALTSVAAALAFATLGCNNTKSPNADLVPEGTYASTPDGSRNFFVDSSFRGLTTEVHVARQYYGRLVTVASCDAAGAIIEVVHTDFVIDPREASTWSAPFTLTTNPVNGMETLCIAEDVTDTTVDPFLGTSPRERFIDALVEAAGGVRPVTDLGFVGTGNYTMVPRNAAFVLQFDDIIDPATITPQTSIKVIQGNPPVIPFFARIFPDPNFGALADFDGQPGAEFYPTRIIIDPAISPAESLATNIATNLTGFPASLSATLANIQVRIPTVKPVGQVSPLLSNPSNHPVVTNDNGTFDFGSSTRDVVRAFRSGGLAEVTGDPFSGFLPDREMPQIIGAQGANLAGVFQPDASDPMAFTIPTITFNSTLCAQRPVEGDVLTTSVGISAMVLRNSAIPGSLDSGAFNPVTGVASSVKVRVLEPVPAQFAADPAAGFVGNGQGAAQYASAYDSAPDSDDLTRPECFVTVTPNSFGFPDAPNVDITTNAEFAIRFSEPMNRDEMEPYESIKLTRRRVVAQEAADYVAGELRGDLNLRTYSFLPIVPLEHTNGTVETFFLSLGEGDLAPKDLAGNPLSALLSPIEYSVLQSAPTQQSGSRVSRFTSLDEEAPFADLTSDVLTERIPKLEWNGQGSVDVARERLRPRPVVREQVFVTTDQPLPGAMVPGPGTQLPLNPRGARTQFVWRYIDFGLSLYEDGDYPKGLDINRLNVDVEAAYLSPLGSNPIFESYPDFTMYMAHSKALPDEVTSNGALLNASSGIENRFTENLLDQTADPLEEVHPRERGYTINPGDQSLTPNGTTLIPLPMNQGVAEVDKEFYTWRDTAIMTLGGVNTIYGAPPLRNWEVNLEHPRHAVVTMMGEDCSTPNSPVLSPIPSPPSPDVLENPLYLPGQMRTAALPLLLDFRCFNSGTASSGNTFAHGLANASMQPFFRAYSAGGTNQAGVLDIIDPDLETIANGGYDPTSQPPGAEIPGLDNVLYYGALDLVSRVNRLTSIFFAAVDPSSFNPGAGNPNTDYDASYSNPSIVAPVIFPTLLDQPQGTAVELAYRGSSAEIQAGSPERENGQKMDPYGDFFKELPENYDGGPEDVQFNRRGNASCWDASFRYLMFDPMTGDSEINDNVSFLGNSLDWRNDTAQLQGARFFQVRISLISNVATGAVPTVSSLGFGWTNN
ncbi:hypothetical protein [Planctomycetes bacterium Poly30]